MAIDVMNNIYHVCNHLDNCIIECVYSYEFKLRIELNLVHNRINSSFRRKLNTIGLSVVKNASLNQENWN